MVGITRFELVTSPLSGVRSNQLSYTPLSVVNLSNLNKCPYATGFLLFLGFPPLQTNGGAIVSRKEVIQPQVLLRLPCYDFTPVAESTVEGSYFSIPASNEFNSHGVTGGEYKTRERIHRSNADLRLLAIPASCSRVAENNPN